jgi:hypothetical protein
MALLLMIYIKKTDRKENYIGWKIIGFFLLGTFTFRIESWVLPVGIAIFWLYFLPKINQNKLAKKWAAIAGILSFLSGAVITYSTEAYYERVLHVKASKENAFEMKFYEEYEKVKSALGAEGELSLSNLELSVKKDGLIDQFNYYVYYYKNSRSMSAWVVRENGEYQITPHVEQEETNMMLMQNGISSPAIYFQALDLHGLKKMVPEGDLYLVSFSSTDEVAPEQEDSTIWNIQKSGIEEHVIETVSEEDEQSPFPYQISISSMDHMGGGSYRGAQSRYFIISPELFQ